MWDRLRLGLAGLELTLAALFVQFDLVSPGVEELADGLLHFGGLLDE